METLNTKQRIYYKRLLIESGIEECAHEEFVEDYCMICRNQVSVKKGH